MRPAWVVAAWAGICALFMTLSTLWLRRFERGPLELIWHRAYLAPQTHRMTDDKIVDRLIKR
ncbi:DUF418 domain-containing protein [Streptosporangium album]|uniref:DUF418 domain-containing protein n=1 Tax=Streptosporangium album TaxID=47479 RepID=UPI00161942FE|nr:DUF418 domain-containing protein [Streptosporangium album]